MNLSLPPHGREEYYPETGAIRFLRSQPGPFRVAGVGGSLFPNTGAMFGLDDIRRHDPMASEEYMRMLAKGGLDRRGYFEIFRGFPAKPLAEYTKDDIRREFITEKSCSPRCTVACVHYTSYMDFWRAPQTIPAPPDAPHDGDTGKLVQLQTR